MTEAIDQLQIVGSQDLYEQDQVSHDQGTQDINSFHISMLNRAGNLLRKGAILVEIGTVAAASVIVGAFDSVSASAANRPVAKSAQANKLMSDLLIEETVLSWVGHDSVVANVTLGGSALGYHFGNPVPYSIGPTLLKSVPGAGINSYGTVGDVSKVFVKRNIDTINGPCTFNGNQETTVFTSQTQLGGKPCGQEGSSASSSNSKPGTIKLACASAVHQGHTNNVTQCEQSVNFTQALNLTGDKAAKSAGLSTNRYNKNGVVEIEVLSDPTERIVHSGPNTLVYAVSDNPVSAMIYFTNDHKPGHQLKELIIKNGVPVPQTRWY